MIGEAMVGLVPKTSEPEPVSSGTAAAKFVDDHPGNISQMGTDAVLVLGKEKNPEFLKIALATTEKILAEGKKLTAKEVKQILLTARGESEVSTKTKQKIDAAPGPAPKREKFDWKGSFPNPGDPSKLKLEIQVHDLGVYSKNWLSNPHLEPLKEVIENLRTQAKKIYGEDKVP